MDEHRVRGEESYLSLAVYTLVALALAILIRIFVAAPYVVDGTSMLPTFQNWNYLIIEKLTACVPFTNSCIDLGEPQRGDVIVLDLPQDTSRALIKRVIGLPGDTVVISGTEPTITIYNAAEPAGIRLERTVH